MTDLKAHFAPDWASPPGESILDIAEERGWKQVELARRLGYTEKHVSQLVNGKVPLTIEAAQRLVRVVGSTVDFWLRREANYQKHKARLQEAEAHAGWVSWLDELPIKELMAASAIAKQRVDARNKPAIVDACLRFFGVASPDDWRSCYGEVQMAFRRSRAEQSDIGAISAWLRLGERQAEAFDGPKYDKDKFSRALKEMRGFTCDPPEVFEPKMKGLLRDCGVQLVLVPGIPRAHVSGVARWLGSNHPLIQLSLYGKTNDRFWFTFFHEAAHVLLHANSSEEKKSIFLDDPSSVSLDNPQEREANQWAGDRLVPPQYASRLPCLKNKPDVKAFAKSICVHPGIVVGRLQHDALIPISWMNDLKQSFRFVDAAEL